MTRILSLDDEPEMVGLLSLILGRAGYEHLGTTRNDEAMFILRSEQIDLFTEDLMRPDMDGWEFYARMKANNKLRHIPVIIITAKSQSGDKIFGWQMAKVDDYLTKPFAPQELLAAVERVLIKYSKPLPTEEEKEQGRIWAETFARSHAQLSEEMIGCCIQLLDEIAPSLPNVKRNGHSVLVRGQRGQYEVSLVTGRVTRLPNKSVCIVPKLYQASDLNLCLPFEDASANVQKIISTVLMLSADQDIHDNAILRQLER